MIISPLLNAVKMNKKIMKYFSTLIVIYLIQTISLVSATKKYDISKWDSLSFPLKLLLILYGILIGFILMTFMIFCFNCNAKKTLKQINEDYSKPISLSPNKSLIKRNKQSNPNKIQHSLSKSMHLSENALNFNSTPAKPNDVLSNNIKPIKPDYDISVVIQNDESNAGYDEPVVLIPSTNIENILNSNDNNSIPPVPPNSPVLKLPQLPQRLQPNNGKAKLMESIRNGIHLNETDPVPPKKDTNPRANVLASIRNGKELKSANNTEAVSASKVQVNRNPRANLLASIRNGKKLKKTEPVSNKKQVNNNPKASLMASIRNGKKLKKTKKISKKKKPMDKQSRLMDSIRGGIKLKKTEGINKKRRSPENSLINQIIERKKWMGNVDGTTSDASGWSLAKK